MILNSLAIANFTDKTIIYNFSSIHLLMQQTPKIISKNIHYSIGLVIVCLLILILLWLPDLLKAKKN